MKISISGKVTALTMSLMMTPIPNLALAETVLNTKTKMIPTNVALEEVTKETAKKEVSDYLQKEEVQALLLKQGVSADEVSSRLATLSEQEMKQLAGQIREAKAGGDILITVVLILLIIFLAKRI